MRNEKGKRNGFAAGIGKGMTSLFDNAKGTIVKAMDQNNDGAVDLKDISEIAGTIGHTVGNAAASVTGSVNHAAASIKDSIDAKNRDNELRLFMPLFEDDLKDSEFMLSKMIRLTTMDKRRAASVVCKGSVGHTVIHSDMRIINIYRDSSAAFPIEFYPNADAEVYLADPFISGRYISVDDYFAYMKEARVSELQRIAQDLGAKHFRVTYKEQHTSTASKSFKEKVSAKAQTAKVDAEDFQSRNTQESISVEIAAECSFPGSSPRRPQLIYLKNEPNVQNLIAMRLDPSSPILHHKLVLRLSSSSGIQNAEALKIDAAMKIMKISNTTSVMNAVQKEAHRTLEYEVDF